AHVNTAIVALLALNLVEAPLDVEDAVALFAVEQQHLVDADAVTDEQAAGVQPPGALLLELAAGWDRHALPRREVLGGQQIGPARRVGLQSAFALPGLPRGSRHEGHPAEQPGQQTAAHWLTLRFTPRSCKKSAPLYRSPRLWKGGPCARSAHTFRDSWRGR